MTKNNRPTRSILYDYISAIELDLRYYVSSYNLDVEAYREKVIKRIENNYPNENASDIYESEKYNFLDYGDYFQLISIHFNKNGFNASLFNEFLHNLEKLLPIRTRVMHSRPLLENDLEIVESFVKETKKYNSFIEFTNLKDIKSTINRDSFFDTHSTKSLSNAKPFIESTIENNLPLVDYDDTGFVGRDDYKKEIIKKLKSAHPIISVVGNGGIGKTSTVLSCIYDIIDDDGFPFEKVLWVTLKTKSLQNGEFVELKNSIKSFDLCIKNNDVLSKQSVITIDHLLFYMQAYKTLLILDNLETIDSSEVRPLFEDIPMGSKIIITSRIGIGEYETRLTLGPFSQHESVSFFKRLAKYYGVKALLKATDQETLSFVKRLYYSPLCIKWFVINVAKGNDPNIVVNNQDELIEFCLSNVYEKIKDCSKKVLMIVAAQRKQCSTGELIYINNNDYAQTIESINELCACNFLEQSSLGKYNIPDFAFKYLANKIDTKSEEYQDIQSRINKLYGMLESMKNDNGKNAINKPNRLNPKSDNEFIATIYMMLFIESSSRQNIEEMEKWLDLAQKAAPGFCDIYKVAGYSFGKLKSNNRADECFKIAIQTASEEQLPYIYSFYSMYITNNTNNYDDALQFISKALEKKPNEPYFIANYARALKYSKRFIEASNMIEKLLAMEDIDFSLKRSAISEYVDIQTRILDTLYDSDEKDNQFIKTKKFIDDISQDYYYCPLYKSMNKLVNYSLYFSDKSKTRGLLKEFIEKYFPYLLFATDDKPVDDFVERINTHVNLSIDISNYSVALPKKESGFIKSYNKDRGFGYILTKGGGFIFFHCSKLQFPIEKVVVGQHVSILPYYVNKRWQATSVELIEEDE